MTAWLIKDVEITGPGHHGPTDLLVADGTITAIGAGLTDAGAQVLDAAGLIALPGLVDLHTHLREPGREDAETIETGTRAAALGGFTAVHAMANTEPVADTAGVVEQVWRLGRAAGHCDVQPVARSPSDWPGPGSPSSAPWPTRPPASGCSPTTAGAWPTRCSCAGPWSTSRPSTG